MSSLMVGLAGTELDSLGRELLLHPTVAGVILFQRNYVDRMQLAGLCREIRAVAPDALIAVDQEGGRVQRFGTGHTALPALAEIGRLYERQPFAARRAARLHAQIMAVEVLGDGLDLSFAPVADLARGNLAIGDRAFHAEPLICAELTAVYAHSMQACGMPATLKHFPGHGSVLADTHHDRAIDARPLREIFDEDLLPFAVGVEAGARAVMMAHVEYPHGDAAAAGYSRYWIKDVLRRGLGFRGMVISDDIGMVAGAQVAQVSARLAQHAQAGCDLILVCAPALVADAVDAAATLGFVTRPPLRKALRGRLQAGLRRERESSTWDRLGARLAALFEAVSVYP